MTVGERGKPKTTEGIDECCEATPALVLASAFLFSLRRGNHTRFPTYVRRPISPITTIHSTLHVSLHTSTTPVWPRTAHPVRSGGETRMTTSPRTNSISTVRRDVCWGGGSRFVG